MKKAKNKELNYRNITVSGLPGTGSTTLAEALAKVLGWKYFSGGDFMRHYAIKKGLFDPQNKGHHDATVYSDDFDRQVDFGMRQTLRKESGNILESWLSGFMGQGIAGNLKILVSCSDDAVRIDRIVNRDDLTVKLAKKHVFEREVKNIKKFRRLYHQEWEEWVAGESVIKAEKPIWFWYPEMYDLTIDTYQYSKAQTLRLALDKLGYSKKVDYEKIF